MKVLVTGATGLLGNNIVRQCLSRGDRPLCVVRKKGDKSLSKLDVEEIQASLDDAEQLEAHASQSDAIIHCAAHIHIGWKYLDEALRVNQAGTHNVVNLALKFNLPMVHVSSINTLAVGSKSSPADEDTVGDGQVPSTYVLSKRASEAVVRDALPKGLRARIVHPGFMLGPWDWKPSSGRMIVECYRQWSPMAPSGGNSICDVRDVANGVLAALDKGVDGRHYILAGENLTFFDLWSRFAKELGRWPPWTILRKPGQVVVGTIGDLVSRFSQRESDLNSAAVRMASQFHWYRSDRAQRELGYASRPVEESIRDSISWLREQGYLTKS